ncbi:helicase associated domain-containing protein [Kitasatospora sp. NPDC101155]|uniref:helicase associated domain-containing protein n=1 Tax=Kitasatospora sp. NPDC101155 TaxID=3364097 RepID=UPI00380735DD
MAAKTAADAKPKVSREDRFQQGLAALAAFVEREGHTKVPRPHKEPLEIVVTGPGGEESVEVVSVGLGPKVSRADRFAQGLAALAAFVEREGHVRVPRTHKEGGVSLGTWLNNQKARRDKLSPEQLGQLEALGVAW